MHEGHIFNSCQHVPLHAGTCGSTLGASTHHFAAGSACKQRVTTPVFCYAVGNKLFMLVAPFLTKWTYTRLHEQVGSISM